MNDADNPFSFLRTNLPARSAVKRNASYKWAIPFILGFIFFICLGAAIEALENYHLVPSSILIFAFLALYFFPTCTAIALRHTDAGAIFVLNLLFGWTFLFWVIALVWASMNSQRVNKRRIQNAPRHKTSSPTAYSTQSYSR